MTGAWIQNIATGILVTCALVVTTLLLRREFGASTAEPVELGVVEDWREWADGGLGIGPSDAPVTIISFSDFQCPACANLATSIHSIRAEFPDKVRLVYRHFPLASHPFAIPAAKASQCAADQGRFEEFHDAIFANQKQLGSWTWEDYARTAGVRDVESFQECMDRFGAFPALEGDTLAGRLLGVSATPTLLINGRRIVGAPPLEELRKRIEHELHNSRLSTTVR